MIKTIALLKRKSGMSHAQFVDYYERRHVPLILSIAPQVCGYRRNFLLSDGAITPPGSAPFEYDVVTELWYPDEAAYQAAMTAFTDPVNAQLIAADEEHVFDRSVTRFYRVDERTSSR
jgi:uncharacterized protein (TIGR02118 family)